MGIGKGWGNMLWGRRGSTPRSSENHLKFLVQVSLGVHLDEHKPTQINELVIFNELPGLLLLSISSPSLFPRKQSQAEIYIAGLPSSTLELSCRHEVRRKKTSAASFRLLSAKEEKFSFQGKPYSWISHLVAFLCPSVFKLFAHMGYKESSLDGAADASVNSSEHLQWSPLFSFVYLFDFYTTHRNTGVHSGWSECTFWCSTFYSQRAVTIRTFFLIFSWNFLSEWRSSYHHRGKYFWGKVKFFHMSKVEMSKPQTIFEIRGVIKKKYSIFQRNLMSF